MSQATKDKISAKLTGRKLSQETKNKISQGQKNAWAKIPYVEPQQQGYGYVETPKNNASNISDLKKKKNN